MHKKEVDGIVFSSLVLSDTCRHGNGGNTCRTDKGIDFALCNNIEELADKHAACCNGTGVGVAGNARYANGARAAYGVNVNVLDFLNDVVSSPERITAVIVTGTPAATAAK